MSDVKISTVRANGMDMTFAEAGKGDPVVLIHGSLSDYRYWTLQMAALGARFRTIAPSLRHYYPERWDGAGDDFNITAAPRGCRRADRCAGYRAGAHRRAFARRSTPRSASRSIIPIASSVWSCRSLAERSNPRFRRRRTPSTGGSNPAVSRRRRTDRIRAGDIDGGLELFLDAVSGPGAWARTPEIGKRFTRDNAMTLLGQVHERREPFSRESAQAIQAKTLFVLGGLSPPMFGQIIEALSSAIGDARTVVIPDATHTMNVIRPALYNAAVIDFLTS